LEEALNLYNDLVAAMNLVLFEDAMMHICRFAKGYNYDVWLIISDVIV